MIAKPIKVYLSQDFEIKVKSLKLSYPLLLTLDRTMLIRNQDGKLVPSYYVQKDYDRKEKKVRLDKYNKEHLVLVIRDAVEIVEKPREVFTLDDLDNF